MPEIRLGSAESFKNINLGPIELQEIFIGSTLIWRNNVPPFFTVSVNGTQVSTSGSPMMPVDPVDPTSTPLQSFEYTSDITLGFSMVVDEDQPMGDITLRLYDGDYDEDDTLPVLSEVTLSPGASGSLVIPKGPQPTGANAADFVYANKLFSVTAEDAEEGISVQYVRIERDDSTDQYVLGGWVDSGSPYGHFSNPIVQTGLTTTYNTACYDQTSTTETFTRTTPRTQASQDQTQTCSVQIYGVQDVPPITCTAAQTARTVTVTTFTGSPSDTTTGTVNFPNSGYVSGAAVNNTVGSPGNINATDSVTTGTCTGPNCAFFTATCTGGSQSVTTIPMTQQTNCAGLGIGVFDAGTPITGTQSCNYTNPVYLAPAVTGTLAPSALNNGARWDGTMARDSGTLSCNYVCVDGSTPTPANRSISCDNPAQNPSITGAPCVADRSASGSCNVASTGGIQSATCTVSSGGASITLSF